MQIKRNLINALILGFTLVSFSASAAWPSYEVPKNGDFVETLGHPSTDSLNPNHISVLVWNMYKGQNETWKEDYLELSKNKDILLLQEMFLNEKMRSTFSEQEGIEFQTGTSFIYVKDDAKTGVINASTAKAQEIIPRQSKVREPVINTPKMAMITTYSLAGRNDKLMVINIHAINFVTALELSVQLFDLASFIEKHNGPVVFAGDFNVWSTQKQKLLFYIVKKLGLKTVEFDPASDDRMRVFGRIIDFIFIRGLEYDNSRVWGEIEGSDHKAMTVDLKTI
ncbi:endonuclease/exonuclease/phosphatase family protein [Bacteriovorax sp. BSW11_IV]|uniref:endonuclease/exonuclease/phosphatase family protein n=1 Tax=Bacteriovorax sp. BSW11_IV TaxID=1353529 RepID=UPI00038A38E1|nr:endonuclease/exonuclease/phosphatase family protein [Bacteriovorax sp. BSW11_IV]EQC48840.1 endonuclease/exonuclease/phosphatase family protein [Bacteriovorax sp. BSW11_IV]